MIVAKNGKIKTYDIDPSKGIAEYKNGVLTYRDTTPEEMVEMQPIDYAETVNNEIRKRYSVSEEFAILRQKEEKPEEYSEYYAYCEKCKAYVKKMIAESNSLAETPDSGEVTE